MKISPRHDSLMTTLGDRGDRGLWRLWVEDNGFDRLRRNNFTPGTAFTVERRAGTGLILRESVLGSCHVSSRKGAGLLSYEAGDLGSFLSVPEIRVRIHVGQIVVTPRLRMHTVARAAAELWTISRTGLTTPSGVYDLRSTNPLSLLHTAGTIEAHLDEGNLVYATELIGNQRPGRVVVRGEALLLTIAGQFLRAAGYGETGTPGEFVR